jgi:3-oxoacyl-[acyl-carrier-protein] synthase-3
MSPHAAPLVAGALGIRGAAAIDVSAACTGFLSGLATAAAMIETGARGPRSSSARTG